MSMKHQIPRQDRRRVGRAPVRNHAGNPSVGTETPPHNPATILDPQNGRGVDVSGGMRAPGALGPAITRD